MRERYKGNARVLKAQLNRLKRSFETLMMKNGESITDYFERVMLVANEMGNCRGDMSGNLIVQNREGKFYCVFYRRIKGF